MDRVMDRVKGDVSGQAIRVFLLIGNRLLRDTLFRLFRKPTDVSIVGQCAPTAEACSDVQNSQADVVLMDSLPLPDAASLADSESSPAAALGAEILLVGMDDDEEQFFSAIRSGYTGYLLKDASAGDVLSAVRAIARGGAVCPPKLCMALFKRIADESRLAGERGENLRPSLTLRQQQLVALVARGLTNKEIAGELNLSEFTVKNHLRRIMRQVDADSRQEAVETARAHGYLGATAASPRVAISERSQTTQRPEGRPLTLA